MYLSWARRTMHWLAVVCTLLFAAVCHGDQYLIGTGRADITGPAAEVNMMGYAMPTQTSHGIHFRQYSRAFIISDTMKKSRVVFVNADICMGTQILKMEVVTRLEAMYGDVYTDQNVLISGIHTHSGPAGYFQYVLFEVTSLGFVEQSLNVTVDGIVESIKIAHENMVLGNLTINRGDLVTPQSNINRSPYSYTFNPEAKNTTKYPYDVDKGMVVLKMVHSDGTGLGMIDWFAVHCTSMNNTNKLISGDNKGHASILMERAMNGDSYFPGQGPFVAAFAQSNEGDVSPNTKGPHCQDTGKPCNFHHSTCNGKTELCVSPGPGKDMFESTKMIGENQFNFGKQLYDSATEVISGPIDYRHTYIDMSKITINYANGTQAHTCKPAMGYSFAAGTTDGPGAFDFTQGTTKSNPFWNFIRDVLHDPSAEQVACHAPKPILLDTGEMNFPYPWQATILPIQLLRVGQLVIIGVPAEFTTMSGRRLRDTVREVLLENGFDKNVIPVIAGLSNTYADYVATFEEYQQQRYEAGSTPYGPHTLEAYQQEFARLAKALAVKNGTVGPGPSPPNYRKKQWEFLPKVLFDRPPEGKNFGDVNTDAKSTYMVNQTVVVEFWAGNPRNDPMTGKTFLTVERQNGAAWDVVLTDGHWDTRFHWSHTSIIDDILGESLATVEWNIMPGTLAGSYRIQHFGHYKSLGSGEIKPYSGMSSVFKVTV